MEHSLSTDRERSRGCRSGHQKRMGMRWCGAGRKGRKLKLKLKFDKSNRTTTTTSVEKMKVYAEMYRWPHGGKVEAPGDRPISVASYLNKMSKNECEKDRQKPETSFHTD